MNMQKSCCRQFSPLYAHQSLYRWQKKTTGSKKIQLTSRYFIALAFARFNPHWVYMEHVRFLTKLFVATAYKHILTALDRYTQAILATHCRCISMELFKWFTQKWLTEQKPCKIYLCFDASYLRICWKWFTFLTAFSKQDIWKRRMFRMFCRT